MDSPQVISDDDQIATGILSLTAPSVVGSEAAVDRVRDKYGPGIIGPAAAVRRAS